MTTSEGNPRSFPSPVTRTCHPGGRTSRSSAQTQINARTSSEPRPWQPVEECRNRQRDWALAVYSALCMLSLAPFSPLWHLITLPVSLPKLIRSFVNSLVIFLAVYLLGGIAYQRTVMHQRGWRQLPNYNVWASIFSVVRDIIIILTSSCARLLPRRQGYNQLPGNGRGGTRGGRADDENRLIDQLDEEWDD